MLFKRTIIMITSLLLAGVVVFLLNIDDSNQTNSITESTINNSESNDTTEINESEEVQSETETDTPIAEEIAETVKQVIEDAIGLFVKEDLNIVAIGDSLTQGVGDTTDNGGYVGILRNTFEESDQEVNIENYGKRGNRSDQLLKRLEQEEIVASIEDADIVLITIGANDIMKVVRNNFTNLQTEPFEAERANYVVRLRAVFDKILSINPNSEVYLIGFYNPFEKYFQNIDELGEILYNWNTAGRNITDDYENVHYIPTTDLFQGTNEDLLSDDNFHPNLKGYKLIAERVFNNIKPSIEVTQNSAEKVNVNGGATAER